MSEQRVFAAVQANTAAMNAQALEPYAETFTDDLVWDGDHLPAPVIGPTAAAQAMGAFITAFPDLRFEVQREFASGDQAAVCWRVTGTHLGDFAGIPPTGRQVEYNACAIFQVRDGKVSRAWTYLDTGRILRRRHPTGTRDLPVSRSSPWVPDSSPPRAFRYPRRR